MKQFRFSLQALLTVRERTEQIALENYSNALCARRRALENAALVQKEQADSWQYRRNQMRQPCSAGTLVQWHTCDNQLTERRKIADEAVVQAEESTVKALEQMLVARRNREAVQKYLERQRSEYARKLSREEQSSLDELGQRRGLAACSSLELEGTLK